MLKNTIANGNYFEKRPRKYQKEMTNLNKALIFDWNIIKFCFLFFSYWQKTFIFFAPTNKSFYFLKDYVKESSTSNTFQTSNVHDFENFKESYILFGLNHSKLKSYYVCHAATDYDDGFHIIIKFRILRRNYSSLSIFYIYTTWQCC